MKIEDMIAEWDALEAAFTRAKATYNAAREAARDCGASIRDRVYDGHYDEYGLSHRCRIGERIFLFRRLSDYEGDVKPMREERLPPRLMEDSGDEG